MDWREPIAGAGGGLLAVILQWMLGRSDAAQAKRDAETRRIAREVLIEQAIDKRVTLVEEILPRVEKKIDDTAELVRSTNDTLNTLAREARLHVRRDE